MSEDSLTKAVWKTYGDATKTTLDRYLNEEISWEEYKILEGPFLNKAIEQIKEVGSQT